MASFEDMMSAGSASTQGERAEEKKQDLKDAREHAVMKDAVKEGTVEGMEAFNRNVRNLPGYKGLSGAEFDAASPGKETITIGSITFVVQQPMSVSDAAKRAADFARHGGIVTVPTRGGRPTGRN